MAQCTACSSCEGRTEFFDHAVELVLGRVAARLGVCAGAPQLEAAEQGKGKTTAKLCPGGPQSVSIQRLIHWEVRRFYREIEIRFIRTGKIELLEAKTEIYQGRERPLMRD
jgi:hypothetical protein